ncbi:MAG: hypothetical protein J7M05_08070 [Anaerolineae bacterium]|nr:hypothetical protein [Anaerolineae bacterium]
MRQKALFLIWATLFALGLASLALAQRPSEDTDVIHITEDITSTTQWTKEHLYVIENDITIIPGATLAIEGGTIIKFAPFADLIVQGALQVNEPPAFVHIFLPIIFKGGALTQNAALLPLLRLSPTLPAVEKVYFTSLKDDTLGGDTNGDGEASTPQKGDWGAIIFFKDSSQDALCFMHDFEIRYSGQSREGNWVGAILLHNASPYLHAGQFIENYLNGIEIPRSNWLNDIWDVRGIAYHITGDVTIPRGNLLRIAPGVVLKFAPQKQLKVQGTLSAIGSAEAPILFTSIKDDTALGDTNGDGSASAPQVRDWGGIYFDDESRANPGIISHAEIRYSGRGIMPYVAAIELNNCSPTLQQITFVDNYLNGAHLFASRDELETLTLTSRDVPYCILEDLHVPRGETLTLAPGVVLKFALNRSLHIEGVLQALGTQAQAITLTSLKDDTALNDTNNDGILTSPRPGDWGCVFFGDRSDDSRNRMEWVIIRYGGRDSLEFSSKIGGIRLDNASPTLRHIQFLNNWINAVEIPAGDWKTDTWDNTDVVYFISGDLHIPAGHTLRIAPGVIVKILNRISPTVPPRIIVDGALQIGDLAGPPVTLTSGRDDTVGPPGANWDSNGDGSATAPAAHDWVGIIFTSSADVEHSFFYNAHLLYGGTPKGTFQKPHGVLRLQGVSIPIEHCAFRENWRGIEALDGAAPTITLSIFENNEEYAVYNNAYLTTTVQATNNWWGAFNGPRSDEEPCNEAQGDGDMISCGVNFAPWLTARPW